MYSTAFNTSSILTMDLSPYAPEPGSVVESLTPIDESTEEITVIDSTYWENLTDDVLRTELANQRYNPPTPHKETETFLYGGSEDNYWHSKGVFASDVDEITAYYGGGGVDTVDYARSDTAIGLSLKFGVGLVGEAAGDTFFSIENIVGSDFDDVIVGSDKLIGNTIDGGKGSDIIFGEGGNDVIRGGNGHDDMYGGTGTDIFEWTHYGGNYVGADRVYDFDIQGELLRFRVDNPAIVEVEVTEMEFEGKNGLMIEVIETYDNNQPTIRYDVFLDDVTTEQFTEQHYEIF